VHTSSTQLPQFLYRSGVEKLLLLSPNQVRPELACTLENRIIDLIHHRPALQPSLHLSLKPRSTRPSFARMHTADCMPESLERPHAHERRLSEADLADEKNFRHSEGLHSRVHPPAVEIGTLSPLPALPRNPSPGVRRG
jgi:hypothetical protein